MDPRSNLDEKRETNTQIIEYFKHTSKKGDTRLMTVIMGIPFYCSTGRNSTQKDTWLPDRGFDEKNTVLMKPTREDSVFPKDILKKWKKLELTKLIMLRRLGNLQTMCISASLDTGFWQHAEAKELKKYLKERYPGYFNVNFLIKEQEKEQTEEIEQPRLVNERLSKLGSIVLLNEANSRLPLPQEIEIFSRSHSSVIASILQSMLTSYHKITEQDYELLLKLDKNPSIITYVKQNHLFEDRFIIEALKERYQKNQTELTLSELMKMNSLYNTTLSPDEYQDLLNDEIGHSALRILSMTNDFTTSNLRMIRSLAATNKLHEWVTELKNVWVRRALAGVSEIQNLDQESLSILKTLNDKGILKHKITLLLNDKLVYQAIKKLNEHHLLVEKMLTTLFELRANELLEKAMPFLDTPVGCLALSQIHKGEVISEKDLDFLSSLEARELLSESAILLDDKCSSTILGVLLDSGLLDNDKNKQKLMAQLKQMHAEKAITKATINSCFKTLISSVKHVVAKVDVAKDASKTAPVVPSALKTNTLFTEPVVGPVKDEKIETDEEIKKHIK